MAKSKNKDNSEKNAKLTENKEYSELKEKLGVLRDELAKKLTQIEDLLNTVKINLEAKYYALIGINELELFNLKVEVQKLKREFEIIVSYKNRNENITDEDILTILDSEFEEWTKKVTEMKNKIIEANKYLKQEKLSDDETKEIRKLYMDLVKRFHPDINSEQDENTKGMWNQISDAYRDGDLFSLRAYYLIANSNEDFNKTFDDDESPLKIIKNKINLYIDKIKAIINRMEDINRTFP
ncbi:MAG TPA: hypothetical protein PLO89_10440, partial [Spirochaetota bacterium]|nr:hypothetical protein [Spirochaetota bacterium]